MPPHVSSARNFTVCTPAANFGMPFLKGIHYHHFRVEIAAEVWVEHSVLPLRDDTASGINEHGAHPVVPVLRRHQRLPTGDHAELLILVMRRLCVHGGKSSFQVL